MSLREFYRWRVPDDLGGWLSFAADATGEAVFTNNLLSSGLIDAYLYRCLSYGKVFFHNFID